VSAKLGADEAPWLTLASFSERIATLQGQLPEDPVRAERQTRLMTELAGYGDHLQQKYVA
jgi:hypothetical protein